MSKTAYLIAGRSSSEIFLKDALKSRNKEDLIFAVDSGLEALEAIDLMPDIILGDFDSVDKEVFNRYKANSNISIVRHNPVKDASDSELAIEECIKAGMEEIYLLNCLGGRMDHTLANLHLAYKCVNEGVKVYILDEFNKIYFKTAPFELYKSKLYGKYIAFFSTSKRVENFVIEGFKYSLNKVTLDSWSNPSLTISNEIIEDKAYVSFESGTVMVIESRDCKTANRTG